MDTKLTDLFPLEEGVNDPAIFKAVFLAGGPGSGKSFIVGKTALTSFGLKVVNSDDAFENALKKAGMETTPENIFSTKGQSLRDRASKLTKMRQASFLNGRLGLVIDGTGKDFEKIRKQKIELEKLGYSTAMILVNTNLDTAVARDKKRARTLGKARVEPMWKAVQNNIGKFQNLFGNQFIVVDNSDGANYEGGIMSAYRKIGQWTRTPPNNHIAQRWIRDQKQQRNITRESVPDDENYIDEACWVGWKQKGMKKKGNRIVPNCVKEDDLEEKIKDMEMGDVIKDFYKSDAPQFKGKSKKKRREMAIAAKLQSQEEDVQEDLRKWFGKGPKGDWVRVGTDGEIKGKCAREPGEGKPKCMPRSKAHSMSKDDRATSARRKRRKDPVADRPGKGGKPIMVKTDVKEGKMSAADRFAKRLKDKHGMDLDAKLKYYEDMKKKMQQTSAKAVKSEENNLEEMPRWALPALAKTVHKAKYDNAKKALLKLLDRKKKEGGGRLRHSPEYYAQQIQRSTRGMDQVDPRILAKMVTEEYKYEWGTPEATAYMKALTPGEPGETTKKNKTNSKYHYKAKKILEDRKEEEPEIEVLEMDVDSIFTPEDVADMEIQIDNMTFDDMIDLGMYEDEELVDVEDEESDIHDNIDILEVLSIQGRMKRRFAARRNRQKLKVARMRAARRASDPGRLKRRATRGARNMIKARIARGRDIQSLPPAEKARIEAMAKRFSGLVSRLATRMAPIVRRNELKRLTSRNKKPMKAKKYNPARAKAVASKQKAKKFKVKKK